MISGFVEEEGVWQGENFIGRVIDIHSDHLAVLPVGEGACSVKDGCGAGRTNMMVVNAESFEDISGQIQRALDTRDSMDTLHFLNATFDIPQTLKPSLCI